MRITTTDPSTFWARIDASVTRSEGGESNRITSKSAPSRSNRASNAALPTISAGLGGGLPQGNTERPSTSVPRIACSCVRSPARMPTRPPWFSMSNRRWSRGRRMSVSTRSTFCPERAIVTAMLEQTVVLPSCGPAEVIMILRSGFLVPRNIRLVRTDRSASEACDRGLSMANNCRSSSPRLTRGSTPSSRTWKRCEISERSWIVRSAASRSRAAPRPATIAASRAAASWSGMLGKLGRRGFEAYSMMLTLDVSAFRAS